MKHVPLDPVDKPTNVQRMLSNSANTCSKYNETPSSSLREVPARPNNIYEWKMELMSLGSTTRERIRISRACDSCHRFRAKCDGKKHCARCDGKPGRLTAAILIFEAYHEDSQTMDWCANTFGRGRSVAKRRKLSLHHLV